MDSFAVLIIACHYILIGVLCVYGAHRVGLTFAARQWGREAPPIANDDGENDAFLPTVTVQAPVFNERCVIERLIDALAALDYPADRLQIQIIDDSTDDSVLLAAKRIAFHRARGVNIEHVRRRDRSGFKAGALDAATALAAGEFLAIFDADFTPPPDFLKKTMPHFADPQVGMVQTRWAHLNTESNTLTRVQAIMLDGHFSIEQAARSRLGAYFNFNGTAGVWRRQTIADAGGWRADTLTEDLDLSYRAQMKGWRFVYLRDIGCPSELPTDMGAFKTQQHRWAKGAIEVMKKMLAVIWKSPAPLRAKVEATFHLTANVSYLLMLTDALFFLVPSIHIRESAGWSFLGWLDIPLFLFATASHAWFFLYGQKLLYGRILGKLSALPALFATSVGLAVNNSCAVIEALMGRTTAFIRTPKTGAVSEGAPQRSRKAYKAFAALWADRFELAIGALYVVYFCWAALRGYYLVLPFLALFAGGFLYTGMMSLKGRLADRRLGDDIC